MRAAAATAAAKSIQSCLTLCDSRDGSPPGSPVPGILQARTLEWVAIFFIWELLSAKNDYVFFQLSLIELVTDDLHSPT